MNETRVKISDGGRVVIPADFRKSLGFQKGDEVVLRIENGELRILSVKKAIENAQQMIRSYVPKEKSLVDELIAERNMESKYE